MRTPGGGLLLMIESRIPRACRSATAAWAREVRVLSLVTRVRSTSERTADIFVDGIRGSRVDGNGDMVDDVMTTSRCRRWGATAGHPAPTVRPLHRGRRFPRDRPVTLANPRPRRRAPAAR